MQMHQIRYFLAVVEELNFTRAAEKCHVAQPSLTRAVKLLEEELGGALFHRERANTHLTELGRMVRPHLENAWAETQAAKSLAQDFRSLTLTKLRLGVTRTIAPDRLIELFAGLRRRHPGIEVEIIDAEADDLMRRLHAGEVEAAICGSARPGEEGRTHFDVLFRERVVIVLAAGHPLAARPSIRLDDLKNETLIQRSSSDCGSILDAMPLAAGELCPSLSCERDDWVVAMAAAGLGCALMPESFATHPGVVARPIVAPQLWRVVNLATARGRPHSPALAALMRETRIARSGIRQTKTAA
jgi:DNA-binding transcriptional LysR family regulator